MQCGLVVAASCIPHYRASKHLAVLICLQQAVHAIVVQTIVTASDTAARSQQSESR